MAGRGTGSAAAVAAAAVAEAAEDDADDAESATIAAMAETIGRTEGFHPRRLGASVDLEENATAVVREALAGTGIEAVASCSLAAYDARAPEAFQSSRFLGGARGLVVAASAGPRLWRALLEQIRSGRASWDDP